MLLLTNPGTADKLQLVTSAAATVDVHASYVDVSNANPPVVQGDTMGRTNTAITTAATTDIVAGPGSGDIRNVKTLHIRNKSTTAATDVTVQHVISGGTTAELHKTTLGTGDMLEYIEGVGFFKITATAKLNTRLRVATDVTNNTTSAADVTGLTCPILAGKHYNFEAMLIVTSAATTTGIQLSVNGPAATSFRGSGIVTVTGSATSATMSTPTTDVTTVDAVIAVQTTGPTGTVPAIIFGWYNPSADGTFAVRVRSEVASSTVTVKAGSSCRIWESDN